MFSPDASLWALVCLGELHKAGALEHAPSGWFPCLRCTASPRARQGPDPATGTRAPGYLDALIAMLERYEFKSVPAAALSAYMTSEDAGAAAAPAGGDHN